MSFQEKCMELKQILNFDVDIFTAIIIGLAAQRPVRIHTHHPDVVEKCALVVAANILGYDQRLLYRCDADADVDHFLNGVSDWRESGQTDKQLMPFLILRNVASLSNECQALLLEVLQTGKTTYRGVTYSKPPGFLLLSVSKNDVYMFEYLRDEFFVYHECHVDSEVNIGQLIESISEERTASPPLMTAADIKMLHDKASKVSIVAELQRYMQDIIVHIRCHRVVARAIKPKAARDFTLFVRHMCVLNDSDFATPSVIAVAARKLLPSSVHIASPEFEPSLAYGSDYKLIEEYITSWDGALVVEDVLNRVKAPV
ncbi:hypothetical protein CJU89_0979 [Yarrowia sp. B02]|nr:hypothetical protein CJU89_0979 [Yarrowia sp. B02]